MQWPRNANRLKTLAGAPGFEPGNGGIKIRCLTTWLRPKTCREPADIWLRPARRTIAAHAPRFNL